MMIYNNCIKKNRFFYGVFVTGVSWVPYALFCQGNSVSGWWAGSCCPNRAKTLDFPWNTCHAFGCLQPLLKSISKIKLSWLVLIAHPWSFKIYNLIWISFRHKGDFDDINVWHFRKNAMSGAAFGTVNFTRRFSAADYTDLLDSDGSAPASATASATPGDAGAHMWFETFHFPLKHFMVHTSSFFTFWIVVTPSNKIMLSHQVS